MTLKQINVVTISYKKLPAKRKVAVKPKSRVGQKNATYRPKPLSHTVRRGQTWEQIAAYYGTSPYQLRSWNSHLDAHVPPPVGMILSIGQKASAKQKAMNPNLKHAVRTHKVVYGESWNSIASRYGTSPDILRGLNPNINGHTILKSGMVIRVL
nr:LysM peptidoglycan-binding domain-containing protein [Paenibacillus sp. ACRRX]